MFMTPKECKAGWFKCEKSRIFIMKRVVKKTPFSKADLEG